MFDIIGIGDTVRVKNNAKELTSNVQFNVRGHMDKLLGEDVVIKDVWNMDTYDAYWVTDDDGALWALGREHFLTKHQMEDVVNLNNTPDEVEYRFGTQVLLDIPKGDAPTGGWGIMKDKQSAIGLVLGSKGDNIIVGFPYQIFYAKRDELKVVGQTFFEGGYPCTTEE